MVTVGLSANKQQLCPGIPRLGRTRCTAGGFALPCYGFLSDWSTWAICISARLCWNWSVSSREGLKDFRSLISPWSWAKNTSILKRSRRAGSKLQGSSERWVTDIQLLQKLGWCLSYTTSTQQGMVCHKTTTVQRQSEAVHSPSEIQQLERRTVHPLSTLKDKGIWGTQSESDSCLTCSSILLNMEWIHLEIPDEHDSFLNWSRD